MSRSRSSALSDVLPARIRPTPQRLVGRTSRCPICPIGGRGKSRRTSPASLAPMSDASPGTFRARADHALRGRRRSSPRASSTSSARRRSRRPLARRGRRPRDPRPRRRRLHGLLGPQGAAGGAPVLPRRRPALRHRPPSEPCSRVLELVDLGARVRGRRGAADPGLADRAGRGQGDHQRAQHHAVDHEDQHGVVRQEAQQERDRRVAEDEGEDGRDRERAEADVVLAA